MNVLNKNEWCFDGADWYYTLAPDGYYVVVKARGVGFGYLIMHGLGTEVEPAPYRSRENAMLMALRKLAEVTSEQHA